MLGFQVFELEAQIYAAEMLKDVQHEKRRDHAPHRNRPPQLLQLRRLDVPHQPRIVDPLHGVKLRRSRFSLNPLHDYTLSAHRSFALRERGLAAFSSSVGWITCRVSTRSVP